MEEVGLGLEEWELKERNLEKAFKICYSRCNKVEDEFNSTRNSFKARKEEIRLREKQLEEKESYFESLRVSKEEELDAIEEVITEKLMQVEQVKTKLECVSSLVEEKRQELDSKEKRSLEVEKLVRENERVCGLIQKRIEEGTVHLRRIEKVIGDVDEKVRSFRLHEKCMENWCHKLDLETEELLEGFLKKIAWKDELLSQTIGEIHFLNDRVKHCLNEAQEIEMETELKETLVQSKVEKLKLTDMRINQRLNEVESKEKQFDLLEKSVQEEKQCLVSLLKTAELNQRQCGFQLNIEQLEHDPGASNKAISLSGNNGKLESSMATSSVTDLSSNVQPCATSYQRDVPRFSEDNQYKFVSYSADFILILIQKKHILEAVRSICTFKLIDKLPPVPLLKKYVEDEKKCFQVLCRMRIALDEKVKAVDNLIGFLRAVQRCIKDCNLETELSADIEMQVVELEKLKKTWRFLAPFVGSKDEQKEQGKRKEPDNKTCSPEFQPRQQSKLKLLFSSGS